MITTCDIIPVTSFSATSCSLSALKGEGIGELAHLLRRTIQTLNTSSATSSDSDEDEDSDGDSGSDSDSDSEGGSNRDRQRS